MSAPGTTPTRPTSGAPLAAIALVVAAIVSVQVGSAIAKHTFSRVTPIGMLWLRLTGATAVLGLARLAGAAQQRRHSADTDPQPSAPTRDVRALLFYAAAMVGMNATFYEGLRRLPVGLAVTIEFLGPLAVGALGARRRRDLAWPLLALVGVALLGLSPVRPNPMGVLFCLGAAVCWGLYIPASQRTGRTWRPVDALFAACALGSLASLVPAVVANGTALLQPGVLLVGLGVGAMSTALPYSLEMAALRTLPQRVFGVLMSLEPVAAALAALVLIGERLALLDVVAMTCVVVASIGATRSA